MKNFATMVAEANSDANTTQVTAFSEDMKKPSTRSLGPTYLEKDEIFRFTNVKENGNLFIDNNLTQTDKNGKKRFVFYTFVEMLDPTTKQPTGAGKKFYLGSLCKTVYGYAYDETENVVKKLPNKYITTGGAVSDDIQKSDDLISALQSIENRPIVVSDVLEIETKRFNPKPDESLLRTASTFVLNYI